MISETTVTNPVKILVFETAEGDKTEVEEEVMKPSNLIRNLIEEQGDELEFPITQVKKKIFDRVVEYLTHLREGNMPPTLQRPLKSDHLGDLVSPWYAQFIDKCASTKSELMDLTLAANYLDIPHLLDLACAKIATEIKTRTIPEVREYFGIDNDFRPEEEAHINEENQWANECF